VILISGSGSNLQSIIDASSTGYLCAKVTAVISDNPSAYGLERAKLAGIDCVALAPQANESRQQYDQRLAATTSTYAPDLIILAGFMRILSAWFVEKFAGMILNIHPSLLPDFKGTNTHQRALDAGRLSHGATVHVVTESLDDGPIILQASVPVLPQDDAESLGQRVLEQEHIIYPQAIKEYARRIFPDGRQKDRDIEHGK